ncbi:MAG: hypothetical protein ACLUKE_08665 [Blautia wexlerae]
MPDQCDRVMVSITTRFRFIKNEDSGAHLFWDFWIVDAVCGGIRDPAPEAP